MSPDAWEWGASEVKGNRGENANELETKVNKDGKWNANSNRASSIMAMVHLKVGHVRKIHSISIKEG